MAKRLAAKRRELRTRLAHEAARLMAEEGIKDFFSAKRKAAERLGVTERMATFPNNVEIERSLAEYQRLFKPGVVGKRLQALRETARHAMELFAEFRPRLVGAVLSGNATAFSDVELHVFDDTPESIAIHLLEKTIPFREGEKQVRHRNGDTRVMPSFSFLAGDIGIEVTVFPFDDVRAPPPCPVDGKPMRRASIEELEGLLVAG